jgi:hypothetical protein
MQSSHAHLVMAETVAKENHTLLYQDYHTEWHSSRREAQATSHAKDYCNSYPTKNSGTMVMPRDSHANFIHCVHVNFYGQ